MSSLLASLQNAAGALNVFENAIGVVQSNVTNASTPGYVNRTPALTTDALGNVATAATENSRNRFAEEAVWQQNGLLGFASAQADNLSGLQSQFDVSGKNGIPGALSSLYSAFSSWSTTPDDATARNGVLTAAGQVAQAFNQASASAQSSVTQANQQISSSVDQINQLTSKIVTINAQIRKGSGDDPSLQTQLYNALQQLSNFSTISVHMEVDDTATVLMNAQVPLVVGATQTALQLSYASTSGSTALPDAQITTSDGRDVTSSAAAGGQLGGLLQVRNETLPGLIGNANQQGGLNELAQGIASQVNTLLASGQTSSGTPGIPLFTYTASSPTGIAGSLSVNPAVTASDLAAIQTGPPIVANGVAAKLAALQNPTDSASMLHGMSFSNFYGSIASGLGSQAADASQEKSNQTDLLNQAENMRSQISGISLDDQAAQLLKYQQAYGASSKLISVINDITADLMNIIR